MDTMSYQTAIAPAFTAAQRQACQAHQVGRFVEDGTLYLERACDGECGRYYALPIENTEMLDAAVKLYAVDEYLCPACREARAARLMRQVATLIGKPYAETRGGTSGSGSKAHQDTPRRPRRPRIAKWLQRLAELDALVERIGRLNLTPAEEREYAKLERRWKQSAGKMTAVP